MRNRSKCLDWWHFNYNIRQCTGHATQRNLLLSQVYQEENTTKKTAVYSKLCFSLKSHIKDQTGVEQAKCYEKKIRRDGLGEPRRAGQRDNGRFIYNRTQRIHTLIKNYKEYRENTLGKGEKSMLAEPLHWGRGRRKNNKPKKPNQPKSQRGILNQN